MAAAVLKRRRDVTAGCVSFSGRYVLRRRRSEHEAGPAAGLLALWLAG
jgi:hypothetical protein